MAGDSAPISGGVLGMRIGIYLRVSTHEQSIQLQHDAIHAYVEQRCWTVVCSITDVSSGAKDRPQRATLLQAARQRRLDAIIVWRLDRWGRSMLDLVTTLHELQALGVGFISLCEALDLTTPTGRAMAGLLAIFAEFERDLIGERVKAGIARAREEGRVWGRPRLPAHVNSAVLSLKQSGMSQAQIARQCQIGRASVQRILRACSTTCNTPTREPDRPV